MAIDPFRNPDREALAATSFYPQIQGFGSGATEGGNQDTPNFQIRIVKRTTEGDTLHWRVLLNSGRGGVNRIVGSFEKDFDRISRSSLDTRFYGGLILPQLTTAATGPDPDAPFAGLHSVNVLDTLFIGVGDGANLALFRETSATDPTLVAVTFSPGATTPITMLAAAKTGSTTAARNLLVGTRSTTAGQGIRVISDTAGTVAATMHDDTRRAWGAIQTFLDNDTILLYTGGGSGAAAIRTLDSTVVSTTAPTVALSNVPNGGCALGLAKLAGAPIRAFWLWPFADNTTGALTFGSEARMRVVSTNQDGTEYQEHTMGLNGVYSACIVNNGSAIIATDLERVTYYDGRSAPRDLQCFTNRGYSSDYAFRARGFAPNGHEILMETNIQESLSTLTINTDRQTEAYNLQTNAWNVISAAEVGPSGQGALSILPAGSLPFSDANRNLHVMIDATSPWRRMFIPPPDYNSFYLYRKTSDGSAGTGRAFESTGDYTSPQWTLPGLEGWPKVISRMIFLGDVNDATDNTTRALVRVEAGELGSTFADGTAMLGEFTTGQTNREQVVLFDDNQSLFYKLQTRIRIQQGSGGTDAANFTSNAFPIIIEGYCWVGSLTPPEDWLEDVR